MLARVRELRRICRPPAHEYHDRHPAFMWFVKNLMQRPSIYITMLLIPLKVSADTVSLARAIICLGCLPYFYLATPELLILALALLYLALVSDCVDGELARYWEVQTLEGSYVDAVTSSLIPITGLLGNALVAHRWSGSSTPLLMIAGLFAVRDLANRSWATILLKLILKPNTTLDANDVGAHAAGRYQPAPGRRSLPYRAVRKLLRLSWAALAWPFFTILFSYIFILPWTAVGIGLGLVLASHWPPTVVLGAYLAHALVTNISQAINIVQGGEVTRTAQRLGLASADAPLKPHAPMSSTDSGG